MAGEVDKKVLVWRAEDRSILTREDAKKVQERVLFLGKPYRSIGEEAFKNNIRLRSLTLDTCIREIEKGSFSGCTSVRSVKMKGVRRIRESAFCGCTSLRETELSENLEFIGKRAFAECIKLKALELPESLQRIGDGAFLKCKELEYVRVPENVKRIEKWAFHGCAKLQVLEILHEPEYIGEWIANKSTRIRCRKGGKVDAYCCEYGIKTEYV